MAGCNTATSAKLQFYRRDKKLSHFYNCNNKNTRFRYVNAVVTWHDMLPMSYCFTVKLPRKLRKMAHVAILLCATLRQEPMSQFYSKIGAYFCDKSPCSTVVPS